ncbi:DNA topoisomerase 1-like [Ziziphus jujuba]|uniref:DNA topoisomerase n=1 Tax=Ziziphus jujuba TaxID=326968 RepID=A0ABM3I7Z6_ZIZJJ|nr:DNA topoisomerase 1-like [Ziziphus jujuba]
MGKIPTKTIDPFGKNHVIQKFDSCDFTPIYDWHQNEKEKKKQMSSEEKKTLREKKLKQEEKYMWAVVDGEKKTLREEKLKQEEKCMWAVIDGVKEKILMIYCDAYIGVLHFSNLWNDPINSKEFKYMFLAASSSLKGQSDKKKYEKARMLKEYIKNIEAAYTKNFTSKDVTKRQIAVATYLIDKLALRAGNEKDDDEADTIGFCTLKVENVKAIGLNMLEFQAGKQGSDDLFDKLDTGKLNAHLKELMPSLTAKVFHTYNASITLDDMLNRETQDGDITKRNYYEHANKKVMTVSLVAIICNHQHTISKSHNAQMSRLMEKLGELQTAVFQVPPPASHAERLEKFDEANFRRWQGKMLFYFTTLRLARFLTEDAPPSDEESDKETLMAVNAWKNSDYLY